MNSTEIRLKFMDFFKSKGHEIVASAPIVLKNDPTLMFTNAGMNQFKDYFLGNQVPKSSRIADTQKCLRVSGKHNDLEEVGIDTYHHTMFEMLGNWSFGDYFKEEAIEWSWELLADVFKLPKDRLYVTVFGGDDKENLEKDLESVEFWKKWVSEDKILFGSKKDNFWEMGDQGPCGPCTEIHIDLRPQAEIDLLSGRELVNNDHPQVIEIWNNVFIQFNRKADGSLEELPAKHVDTGMGFERLVRAVQGKNSNYDTDVFIPLIDFISKETKIEFGKEETLDIAMRVMADHIRAITCTIADGQLPSNTGAGYVIRRILRRAVRYGYTFLNINEPFMYQLVDILAVQFDGVFPEIIAQKDFIKNVVREEENTFLRTLTLGIKKLEQITEELSKTGEKTITGKVVFELYDTYGFPVDLTALIARENNLEIDEAGFVKAMNEQKERSRAASTSETSDWTDLQTGKSVAFVGYDLSENTTSVLKYREITEKKKSFFQIVLAETPFYPEGGGQVGDIGSLDFEGEKIAVIDTKKENDLIIHITEKLPANPKASVKATINTKRRTLSENNHSATHLLQSALRSVLGNHIAQKGSFVNDKLLRFDFSHFAKVTDDEITQVEKIVNQKIRENIVLDERRSIPIADALKLGATALFGEKYGDSVRVITFDPTYSIELCGGTHVPSTAQIGLIKIVSESSVAAGVRRIEAVTSEAAFEYIDDKLSQLDEINEMLKQPKDLVVSVQGLVEERSKLLKQVEKLQQKEINALKDALLTEIKVKDSISIIVAKVDIDGADSLKKLAFDLKNKITDKYFFVLAAEIQNKPQLAVMISEDLISTKGLDAGKIVRELAKEIKGGGGGQSFFATAGGNDLSGLDKVIELAKMYI